MLPGHAVWRRVGDRRPRPVDALPYFLQAVFVLALIGAMLLLRRCLRARDGNEHWIALVLLATTLCNPRIQVYDSDIALAAAIVLRISALGRHRTLLVAAILFLPPIILQFVRHHSPSGLYEICVCLIAFAAGYRMLWGRPSGQSPFGTKPSTYQWKLKALGRGGTELLLFRILVNPSAIYKDGSGNK